MLLKNIWFFVHAGLILATLYSVVTQRHDGNYGLKELSVDFVDFRVDFVDFSVYF
jgi:hypothetical protein